MVWEELLRFLAADRVLLGRSVWASALGVGLCSPSLLSPDAASSAQPSLDISTIYIRFHINMLELVDNIRARGEIKRTNKCLAVEDYF